MTYNVTACQVRRRIKKYNQARSFTFFSSQPDLVPLTTNLYRSMTRNDHTIMYKIMDLFLKMGSNGRRLWMSEAWLAKKFGRHESSISRVLCQLADWGVIQKRQRGVNMSNEYELNPAFNKPMVQVQLYPFFGFLKYLAFNVLLLSTFAVNQALITLPTPNVELRKKRSYLNISSSSKSLYKSKSLNEETLRKTNVSKVYARAHTRKEISDFPITYTNRKSEMRTLGQIMNVALSPETDNPTLTEINRIKKGYLQMQEEPKKGKYNLSWWNPDDPFKATNKILSQYGKAPLPTGEEQLKMTIKDHLALQLSKIEALKLQTKEREDNERHAQRDVQSDSEPPFIDYTEYEPVEDEQVW